MTQKGHQNHYNVKFLSGYGISIKQKENQIILNHKPDPFSESNKEEWLSKTFQMKIRWNENDSSICLEMLVKSIHGKHITYVKQVLYRMISGVEIKQFQIDIHKICRFQQKNTNCNKHP